MLLGDLQLVRVLKLVNTLIFISDYFLNETGNMYVYIMGVFLTLVGMF